MPVERRFVVEDELAAPPVDTEVVQTVAVPAYETAVVREPADQVIRVRQARPVRLVVRIVDFIFIMIYGLLIIRLLLGMFGARGSAGFVQFIRTLTDPIYAPFKGILPSPTSPEGYTLAFPIIAALVIYMLLHGAIHLFLRMFVHRKTVV